MDLNHRPQHYENQNEIILKKTRTEIENDFNIGDKIQVYFNINDGTILKN